MSKYKAKVIKVSAKQQEEATAKLPRGTWYLNVCLIKTQKWVTEHEEWEELQFENNDKTALLSKKYYLSHDIKYKTEKYGETSLYEISRRCLESDLGLPITAKDSELEDLVGVEREVITTLDGDYENIKYINGPKKRSPLVEADKASDFKSIFNGEAKTVGATEDDLPF